MMAVPTAISLLEYYLTYWTLEYLPAKEITTLNENGI